MSKPGELDLRTVLTQPKPVRCSVDEHEVYEVRFEVLAGRCRSGSAIRMHVLRSIDGGQSWQSLRFRRNWRRQWWPIIKDGLGGGWWPPGGDDFKVACIKDGKLAISYWNLWELGPQRQAYVWEMLYDPVADLWNLSLIEEIPD